MTIAAPPLRFQDVLRNAQLPAMPQSAMKLLELSQNPDNGPPEFAVPIEADPGLTCQVLKFVNSSYFGFSREINSVKLGITLVGIRTIKNFALWSALFNLMPNPRCGPIDVKLLWQDSLRRAIFARAFARLLGMKEADEVFAAALLQDMAIPILAKEIPQRYLKLFDKRAAQGRRLSELEREEFGWTHAEAAAFICRNWRLPDEFARLIETHCDIDSLVSEGCKDTGRLAVAMAALLPGGGDREWGDRQQFLSLFGQLTAGKGKSARELLTQVDNEHVDFAPSLRTTNPVRRLADHLQPATV
ncbi:MAG TPA: HDOD domain-containing protein [Pirellulaceae bacterium]|nr:HDOD domain-containing protein [Pirellulaceae bacterium]